MKPAVRRKAFTLAHFLGIVPVFMALMVSGYGLVSHVEGVRTCEDARRQESMRIRDIVRRIQADAGAASEATVGDTANGRDLRLTLPGREVIYASIPGGVVRTERPAEGATLAYDWKLDHARMDFQLEPAAGKTRLIWILCAMELRFDRGPEQVRRISAAATVGRGAVP